MLSFFGGISFFTSDKNSLPFEEIAPPEYVYIKVPAEYEKIVYSGDKVLAGQAIAIKEDSIPFLSSVSGTVEAVFNDEIVIKNDFEDKNVDSLFLDKSLIELSTREIEELANSFCIYDGSIPLSEKIRKTANKVENVIVSCIDSEPTCKTSKAIISDFTSEVIGGLKIIIHAVKARTGIIALSTDNEKVLQTIKDNIDDPSLIISRVVDNKYPSENEKCLLFALKRKELSGKNFIEDGKCLIIKAETAKKLYESMTSGFPSLQAYISVSGKVKSKKNLIVPIGCKIEHILNYCECLVPNDDYSIISNGLMCGKEISEDDVIDFNTKSITVIKKREYKEKDCIRCGKCIKVCPMLLKPLFLYSNIINDQCDKNVFIGVEQCIGCGCCSYVCPSKIPLSAVIYQSINKN